MAKQLLALFTQYPFKRPLLDIFPETHHMPGERQRILEEKPVGICPCPVHLEAGEAIFRWGGQNPFKGGKVRLPRIRIEGKALASVMGVAST